MRLRFRTGLAFIAVLPVALLAHIEGPDARHTAAPGDDQLACATGGCHTGTHTGGPINSAGGQVTATFSSGATYTPGGSPITITVKVTDPSNTRFGFQMTARLESDLSNGAAGDFAAGTNQITRERFRSDDALFIHLDASGDQRRQRPFLRCWECGE